MILKFNLKILLRAETQLIPSTSKKVPPQQVARSEFSHTTSLLFHVITERQKRAFITDAIKVTENILYDSLICLPFERHCKDVYSIARVREHHNSYLYFIQN